MSSSSLKPGGDSSRFRFFSWVIFFLGVATLLVMNDAASPWPGAEARLLAFANGDAAASTLPSTYWPARIYQLLPATGELWLFWPRLLSVISLLTTALLWFYWGRGLFGRPTVIYTLLVVIASFFLPVLGKVATPDSWVLLLHTGAWLGYLRWLKRPQGRAGLVALLLAAVAATVAPLSTLLLLALLLLLPAFSGGQPISRPAYTAIGTVWVLSGLCLLLGAFFDLPLYWSPNHGLRTYSTFLLYNIVGLLPFLGFLLAGLRDMVFKARKGEELSRLLMVGLLAALLAQSPLFALLLALVVAKQLLLCFQPNYPWNNWLRSGQVLHLVVAFIGAVLALLGSTLQLRGAGFRATLGLAAAYWMFSFIAVIGLFGQRRDYVVGGTILAAALPALFFWVQIYPYLEVDRRWPQRVVSQIEAVGQAPRRVAILATDEAATTALPVLPRAGIEIDVIPTPDAAAAAGAYQLLPLGQQPNNATVDTITGRVWIGLQYWGLYPPRK